MKNYRTTLLFQGVALLALAATIYYFSPRLGLVCAGAGAVLMGVTLLLLNGVQRRQQREMDAVFGDNERAASELARKLDLPALLLDMNGRIVWRNEALAAVYDGRNIQEILPHFHPNRPTVQQVLLAGTHFQVMTMPVHRPNAHKKLVFQYWLDRTEAVHYQRLYTEQMPYVMLVNVDNYEELTGEQSFHGAALLAQVERLVAELCRSMNGIYRRYDNGRFLCVLEAAQMAKLEQEQFHLLEQARQLQTDGGASLSLSIAVGVAPRLSQSEESARTAMELALGRGGDQAVVRDGAEYRFYGGKKQQDARQSRVKMRLFSKALRQIVESSGDVFIMGHRNPDMDCLGAALGVMTCVEHSRKRAYIVYSERNDATADALREMDKLGLGERLLLTGEQAIERIRPNSVVVVVDTQRPLMTDCPALLTLAEKVVLIDHHRRGADYIENPTLHYLESRASSACEMVTEVLQYYDEAVQPGAFVCSALLAGIELDTKQFLFNVGSRTFEAAGYLRRNGADPNQVKAMFQSDFESFVRVAKAVEGAQINRSGVAIAAADGQGREGQLIAARAADELLKVRGVKAAFVLADSGDFVSISGRSFGLVNVQRVLERLGGGGHLTMAGAQLREKTMEEAKELLQNALLQQESETIDSESQGGK